MAELIAAAGKLPDPRAGRPERDDHYGALVRAIVGQQLSVHAARAIYARLTDRFGGRPPTPQEILADDPEELRAAAGLSRAKVGFLRSLAEHVISGELELSRLDELGDDEVISELVAVKGLGHVDRAHVHDVPARASRRAGRRGPRHPSCDRARLRARRAARGAARSSRSHSRGAPIERWRAATCGARCTTSPPSPATRSGARRQAGRRRCVLLRWTRRRPSSDSRTHRRRPLCRRPEPCRKGHPIPVLHSTSCQPKLHNAQQRVKPPPGAPTPAGRPALTRLTRTTSGPCKPHPMRARTRPGTQLRAAIRPSDR